MSQAIENLKKAVQHAMSIRPKTQGFPVLAEALRSYGVKRNIWYLPSCQSLYLTDKGNVILQGTPLMTGEIDVPIFDEGSLIRALRVDQAGDSTLPEFLRASFQAGVVSYDVDLENRYVTYFGCQGEQYREDYPAVRI